MGSSTNIGFIYGLNCCNMAETELYKFIEYLISNYGSATYLKYCRDIFGNQWFESNNINNLKLKDISSNLINNYYGQLTIKCSILGKSDLILDVTFHKIDMTNYGILLDITDEQLFISNKSLDVITDKIIKFIQHIYSISKFDYAFCDNEAQIEYALSDLLVLNNPMYSIVVIPQMSSIYNFKVIKNNWHIDGLTQRKI